MLFLACLSFRMNALWTGFGFLASFFHVMMSQVDYGEGLPHQGMIVNLSLMQVKNDDWQHANLELKTPYHVLVDRTTKKLNAKGWQCESIGAKLVFVQFIFIYKVVNKNMNHLLSTGCQMTSSVIILPMLVTGVGQLVWIVLFLHTLSFTLCLYFPKNVFLVNISFDFKLNKVDKRQH